MVKQKSGDEAIELLTKIVEVWKEYFLPQELYELNKRAVEIIKKHEKQKRKP